MPAKRLTVEAEVQRSGDKEVQRGSLSVSDGPLPDPATLAKYEKIRPGVTDILLNELQKEGATRRTCAVISTLGTIAGPLISLAMIYLIFDYSLRLAQAGAPWGSMALVLLGVALIIAFGVGTLKYLKKLKIKANELEVTTHK